MRNNRSLTSAELRHIQLRLLKLSDKVSNQHHFVFSYHSVYGMPKKVVRKNLAFYKRIITACALINSLEHGKY